MARGKEPYPELDFLGLGEVRGFVPDQKLVDRYALRRVLGWGGMGVAWLAFDERVQKEVTLKFLPEIVRLDAFSIEELGLQTRRGKELIHPHIVRILDFVGDDTFAAVAMEFVEGHTLSTWRLSQPNGVFEVQQIREWTTQLLDALDYAHLEAKLVHRDLRPDNLLINEADELKVADFGISRGISDSVCRLSGRGATSDMVIYLSPQQAMGGDPSVQDDIYGFGATFYELLTGKPAFSGDSKEVLAQMWQMVPPSMKERRSMLGIKGARIPDEWEQTIAACLAKDPAARPQSIAEVAERLGFAVAPIPIVVSETAPALVDEPPPEIPAEPAVELPPPEPEPAAPSAAGVVPPKRSAKPGAPLSSPKRSPKPSQPVVELSPAKTPVELSSRKPPSSKFSSKDQLIIISLIILFSLDGLAITYFMLASKDDPARQAQLERLEADTRTATEVAEKLKADEATALATSDQEKAALQKATQDADARAAAAEQAAQAAKADADKAKQTAQTATQKLAAATGPTALHAWTNSLGVKFVPAGAEGVLFSIWDVRVKDYAAFVAASGHDWVKPAFPQTENDPVVKVSWDDAHAFCDWLTKKEQGEGMLASNQQYRLPTDAEWSKAVGLDENSGNTPKENDGAIKDVYPWGNQWPVPSGAGNYAESLTNDGYAKTSPVGSFHANSFGLFDMGGNVWQWCEDKYDYTHDWHVLRGASWVDRAPGSLLSSSRSGDSPGSRDDGSGFRVVVVVATP